MYKNAPINVGIGLYTKITGKIKFNVGFLYPTDTIEALLRYSILNKNFPHDYVYFYTSTIGFIYFYSITWVIPALALIDF